MVSLWVSSSPSVSWCFGGCCDPATGWWGFSRVLSARRVGIHRLSLSRKRRRYLVAQVLGWDGARWQSWILRYSFVYYKPGLSGGRNRIHTLDSGDANHAAAGI